MVRFPPRCSRGSPRRRPGRDGRGSRVRGPPRTRRRRPGTARARTEARARASAPRPPPRRATRGRRPPPRAQLRPLRAARCRCRRSRSGAPSRGGLQLPPGLPRAERHPDVVGKVVGEPEKTGEPCELPSAWPGSKRSSRTQLRSRSAIDRAAAEPAAPAPTTATSNRSIARSVSGGAGNASMGRRDCAHGRSRAASHASAADEPLRARDAHDRRGARAPPGRIRGAQALPPARARRRSAGDRPGPAGPAAPTAQGRSGWAVAIILFATVVFLALFAALVVPPLVREVRQLAANIPDYVTRLRTQQRWLGDLARKVDISEKLQELTDRLPSLASSSFGAVFGFTKGIASVVFSTLTVFYSTIYFLMELPRLRQTVVALFRPHRRDQAGALQTEALDRIGAYVSGNIWTSIIAGICSFIALSLIGVPFAAALAMWVAIADLIPPSVQRSGRSSRSPSPPSPRWRRDHHRDLLHRLPAGGELPDRPAHHEARRRSLPGRRDRQHADRRKPRRVRGRA